MQVAGKGASPSPHRPQNKDIVNFVASQAATSKDTAVGPQSNNTSNNTPALMAMYSNQNSACFCPSQASSSVNATPDRAMNPNRQAFKSN